MTPQQRRNRGFRARTAVDQDTPAYRLAWMMTLYGSTDPVQLAEDDAPAAVVSAARDLAAAGHRLRLGADV
jgi:hypothetical protein